MRRVFLLALLALALPVAASASSIDYANGGFISLGTASVTGTATAGSTITIGSSLTQINFAAATGWVTVTTGTLTATATPGVFNFTAGSIVIKDGSNATLFSGTFTSGTVTALGNGAFAVSATAGNGIAFTTQLSAAGAVSGNTIVTPEPSTLGLLGTGLVGLAGIVRRKMRG
jgi:hypothetical protein